MEATLRTWSDDARLDAAPSRVLVAEDDVEMRALITSMLRRAGYEVIEAENGGQLLHFIGCLLSPGDFFDPPDLIISDIRMPGISGLEILSWLRRADWTMPYIVITAFGDEMTHQEAARCGATMILDKPFELNELRTAVCNLMPLD